LLLFFLFHVAFFFSPLSLLHPQTLPLDDFAAGLSQALPALLDHLDTLVTEQGAEAGP
jgi:hypothetical protein